MQKTYTIFQITEDFTEKNYGVTTSIKEINKFVNSYYNVRVLHFNNNLPWKFSLHLKRELTSNIASYKKLLVHIHGIWQYSQYIGAKIAIKYKKPFIVSPHGMLEPWLMDKKNIGTIKYLKKNLYLKFIALSVFKKANFIHAITPLEKKNLEKYFDKDKIVVIPNAINVEEIKKYVKVPTKNLEKRILFIGRLHPIKGVDILIKAFIEGKFYNEGWELWIVGPEEVPKYVKFLRGLSKGFKKYIKFKPPVFDLKEKFNLYNKSWITVVPSHSEVIGMVNLESASCYTPTITTYETGLLNWEEGGNLLIRPDVESMIKSLKIALQWDLEKRIKLGKKAYNFVKDNFSEKVVSNMWKDFYEEVFNV